MRSITVLAGHCQADVDRFRLLGLKDSQAAVVGSIKFDIQLSRQVKERAEQLKQSLNNYHFIWVAGSTHPGEHQQIIAAHKMLCNVKQKSLLIIAPRHPEQFEKVADILRDDKIAFGRWSAKDLADQPVLLADTMGEMLTFFGAAQCAFIGGSLIDRGGHNPLEAAASAIPVITGPSYYNFKHIFPQLIAKEACTEVHDTCTLYKQLSIYADSPEQVKKIDGEKGLEIVQSNCGAVEKNTQYPSALYSQIALKLTASVYRAPCTAHGDFCVGCLKKAVVMTHWIDQNQMGAVVYSVIIAIQRYWIMGHIQLGG